MKKGSLKKYILPNMPYLFMAWACLKLGTAYRLAAGANVGQKLVGMMATINTAFAAPAPGLDPADWLVGIAGAAAIRLFVYVKAKNAKKFRRDEEYGSARWGGPKDIAPFVDPTFERNVILSGTEFLTTNTRPKKRAAEQEEKKPSISQQMQEAGRQAQERQAPPSPKREAPDRGER